MREAQAALENKGRLLGIILDTIPTPITYKDSSGNYLGINSAFASFFAAAYPRLLVSRSDPGFGIDALAGSSSQATLGLMTIAACVFLPIVIAYQAWKFARFRKDKHEEA